MKEKLNGFINLRNNLVKVFYNTYNLMNISILHTGRNEKVAYPH